MSWKAIIIQAVIFVVIVGTVGKYAWDQVSYVPCSSTFYQPLGTFGNNIYYMLALAGLAMTATGFLYVFSGNHFRKAESVNNELEAKSKLN